MIGSAVVYFVVCTSGESTGAQSESSEQASNSFGYQYQRGSRKENVPYGFADGGELHLDIYQAGARNGGRAPAVILIHGGGWISLDKGTMRGMGQLLARAGFVAFSVDYRLFGAGKNAWPAQLDDVQRATRWVRADADTYGVDPNRVGAFGHSAGAQLVALLGMEDTRNNSDPALVKFSSRVQAVVDVSGPVDFTLDRDQDGDQFLTGFLGAPYDKNPELRRQASPVFHVAKGNAPFLVVYGTQDENVPIAQAEELVKKLEAAGVPVSFVKVDDEHTFRRPEARRTLARETVAFFQRYLSAKP